VAARTGDTLQDLAEAYWKAAEKGLHGGRKRPKAEVTLQNERGRWRTHIQPKLGHRRFAELRRADIRGFMRELAADSGLRPASVGTVGSILQAVLGFAVHEDRLEANPCLGLTRPLAWQSRDRMFSDDAVGALWRALAEATPGTREDRLATQARAVLSASTAFALQFLILTLCRRNEAAGARWQEFDTKLETWTIPAERAKARHTHVVPLSPEARNVLRAAKALGRPDDVYVFPAPRSEAEAVDSHALTRAVSRLCSKLELPPGSPHDMRRSGATTLIGRYGVRRFVVSKVLGHEAEEGARVTSVYDRHSYLPEKREALEIWARHVLEVAYPEASSRPSRSVEPNSRDRTGRSRRRTTSEERNHARPT
jgi:integrase